MVVLSREADKFISRNLDKFAIYFVFGCAIGYVPLVFMIQSAVDKEILEKRKMEQEEKERRSEEIKRMMKAKIRDEKLKHKQAQKEKVLCHEQMASIPKPRTVKKKLNHTRPPRRTQIKKHRVDEDILEYHYTQESPHDINFVERYKCRLKINTFYEAEAYPCDSKKKKVLIRGPWNRIGAFDDDLTEVGIFPDNPQCKNYGRVLDVTERGGDPRFVCRRLKNLVFYPIDGKNPGFLPISVLLTKKVDKDVCIYNPSSLEYDDSHELILRLLNKERTIPYSEALQMVFLVQFVKWSRDKYYPIGIVVGAYPKGYTENDAEQLLKAKYSVKYDQDDTEQFLGADEDSAESQCDPADDSSQKFLNAFTIDPEKAVNLDDAFSMSVKSDADPNLTIYTFGVHIVNVAKHIAMDSEEDKTAREKGISVYSRDASKVMHMLPSRIRGRLSLMPGKPCDVLSVTCDVHIQKNTLKKVDGIQIIPAKIVSIAKLSYLEAQKIMDGYTDDPKLRRLAESFRLSSNLDFKDILRLLLLLSEYLAKERLQSDKSYFYDCSEEEDRHCWKTHKIVTELMLWANSQVARKIYKSFPTGALLRKQDPPNKREENEFTQQYSQILPHSLSLSCYDSRHSTDTPLDVPTVTLEKINKAISETNPTLLANLILSNELYPQLSAADSQARSLLPQAEYCITEACQNKIKYRHHSLHLDTYTHFSSPLRRYVDIVVQRMLLNMDKCSHDNKDLCVLMNKLSKKSSGFKKDLDNAHIAFSLISSSKVYTAFIDSGDGRSITFNFSQLELSNLTLDSRKVKLSHLGPFASKSNSKSGQLRWKILISSMRKKADLQNIYLLPDHVVDVNTSIKYVNESIEILSLNKNDDCLLEKSRYKVDVHPLAVKVGVEIWKEALEFAKQPSLSGLAHLQKTLPESIPSIHAKQNAELSIHESPFLFCNITSTLKQAGVIKLWLSWRLNQFIIEPTVQLIEFSPLFRVCVQHNTHPVECFSDTTLTPASQETYISMDQYVELWKKVLLAEAALVSVTESQPVIIRDVELNWPEFVIPENCTYYTVESSVSMHILKYFVKNCFEYFRISTGDLICARYGTDPHCSVRAVFHLVVHRVNYKEDQDEVTVDMHFVGRNNYRISECMKENIIASTCEIQIIKLSTPYRRVFAGLIGLGKPRLNGTLVSKVALSQEPEIRELAVDIDHIDDEVKKELQSLNESQLESVNIALRKKFHLIQGPPGTGKSVTGAHLACIFALLNKKSGPSDKTVLYCGPSNKSVDVILKHFHDRKSKKLEVLRIYGRAIEGKDFPGPSLIRNKHASDYICPSWAQSYTLHHKIRDPGSEDQFITELRALDDRLKQIPDSAVLSGVFCKNYRNVQKKAEESVLSSKKFDVILCTCNEVSGVRIRRHIHPSHCIIDECGMANEPETIVSICNCEHAVLIGDHKQLQPVINSKQARENGLSRSLFERYAENHQECVSTLTIQYRMHESICAFPSERFYDGILSTDESVTSRENKETKLNRFWPRGAKLPTVFCNVVGSEEEDVTGTRDESRVGIESKSNNAEAQKAVRIVQVLHQDYRVETQQLAILTPYSAQKSMIKKKLQQHGRLKEIKVSTITESQGDEYGIVILSMVRSQPIEEIRHPEYILPDYHWRRRNLGFVTDKHQINVGITRSKYGLVIIGNKMLLSYDPTWKALINHYEEVKCVKDNSDFPLPT